MRHRWVQTEWRGGGGRKKRSVYLCPKPDCNSRVFTERTNKQLHSRNCATYLVRTTELLEEIPSAALQADTVPETVRRYSKTISIEKETTVQKPSQHIQLDLLHKLQQRG